MTSRRSKHPTPEEVATRDLKAVVNGTGRQPVNRTLFVGKDNYDVLRGIDSETVDLIATDPPFNKNAPFTGEVKDPDFFGLTSKTEFRGGKAKTISFKDFWTWNDSHAGWLTRLAVDKQLKPLIEVVEAAQHAHSPGMGAYISFMAARCLEMKRILKPAGSFYMHCDQTALHYLKPMLDAIFGAARFKGEIIWKRMSAHNDSRRFFGNVHDVLLAYGTNPINADEVRVPLNEKYAASAYRYDDNDGNGPYRLLPLHAPSKKPAPGLYGKPWRGVKLPSIKHQWRAHNALTSRFIPPEGYADFNIHRKLDELDRQGFVYWPPRGSVPCFKRYRSLDKGVVPSNVWTDIGLAKPSERMGWPTQKPVELYERIIKSETNKGDVVLDPFCGCATTCVAAEYLEREWIGIDIAEDASIILEHRMRNQIWSSQDSDQVTGKDGTKVFAASVKDLHIRDYAKEGAAALPLRTDDGMMAAPNVSRPSTRNGSKQANQNFDFRRFRRDLKEKLLAAQRRQHPELHPEDLTSPNVAMCQECGQQFMDAANLEVDHITPLAHFRAERPDTPPDQIHHISNVQLLCSACNRRKGSKVRT